VKLIERPLFRVVLNHRWQPIVLWFGAGLLLAVALRYGLLEDSAQDLSCRRDGGGAVCALRSALGLSIHHQVIGLAGLFLGLAGWLPRLRWAAFGGLLLAGCGLMTFNTTYAAMATVISLLAALQPRFQNR